MELGGGAVTLRRPYQPLGRSNHGRSQRRPQRRPGPGWVRSAVVAVVLPVALALGCTDADGNLTLTLGEFDQTPQVVEGVKKASAAGSYLAGIQAQRHRDFSVAADYLHEALLTTPANSRLRRRTYLALVASGRMAEAVELARRIVAVNDKSPLANLTLVAAAMKQGDFAAAQRRLGNMPKAGFNRFMVPLLWSWTIAAQGRSEAAIAALEPVSGISGLQVLYQLHRGLISDLAGDTDAAETAYVKAAGKQPTLRVVQMLGSLYERADRGAKATALYGKFVAENPDTLVLESAMRRARSGKFVQRVVGGAGQGMAEAFFNVASSVTRSRSAEHALVYGRLALYLRPRFPLAKVMVAGILESMGRYDEAMAVYDSIDRTSSVYWSARLRKASALESQGRIEAAIAELTRMAEENAARSDALITLADMLRGEKRYEESVDIYNRAVKRIGELKKRHWSLLYARGISFERSKKWQRAEEDFLEALKLSPDQPYVLNYLGYSWVDQGINLKRAQKMIERAVKLRPNDGYIVDSLGWVLYRVGDFKGAALQLERAVVLRPADPTINDHLGDAYWKVGRLQEARYQWRRALSLKPEPEAIPAIQNKLRRGLAADDKDEKKDSDS